MVDLPLDQLLKIAEADRAEKRSGVSGDGEADRPDEVGRRRARVATERDHPKPAELLKTSQDSLDAIRQFIVDNHILTIPPSEPARVKETPPFMRSTTSASMDTPGPFETAKLEAFYNMTLPDPRRTAAEQEDYMQRWYYAEISNVVRARGLSGPLHPVSLREDVSRRRAQGVRRGDQRRRLGALRRADDDRRGVSRRTIRNIVSHSCRTRCCATSASSSASRCTRRA